MQQAKPLKRKPGQPQLVELVGGEYDGQRAEIQSGTALLAFGPDLIHCDRCAEDGDFSLYPRQLPYCLQCAKPTLDQPEVMVYRLRTISDGHPVMPLQVGVTTEDGALLYDVAVRR